MKQLTCEMCGSTDLIKQDGVFVCQSCGCKYSVEEAKKMMIEGTVEVKGTIEIDTTKSLENNLSCARQSLSVKDWTGAKNFYSRVRKDDPNMEEALIYEYYCQAMESLRVNEIFERQSVFEALKNCLMLFAEKYSVDEVHEDLLKRINGDILELAGTPYVYTSFTKDGVETSNDSEKTKALFCDILAVQGICVVDIAAKYEQENSQMFCDLHEFAISFFEAVLELECWGKDEKAIQNKIMESHKAIAAIDSSHLVPEKPPKASGGCYIATCVYGSYDCPQVWTLRRYRDNTLASTWYGQTFIRTYYAVSPTLVKWFGNTKWFKRLWKGKLDRMVNELKAKGFEDTPYQDKDWR